MTLGELLQASSDIVRDFSNKSCPYFAAAISYYTLFSLFPLSLLVVTLGAFILGPSIEKEELALKISGTIPVSTDFVRETMQSVIEARAITGLVGFIGLVWASTAALGALRRGINAAWGTITPGQFFRERFTDIALTLGAGLLLVTLLFITPIVGFFVELTGYFYPTEALSKAAWNTVAQLLNSAISFLSFLVLYRYLPNARVRFKDVWLGAFLASSVFEGVKWGFVFYVRNFSVYDVVYGSIGGIMALMAWVYISSIIILFGALLTSRVSRSSARIDNLESIRVDTS